MEDDASALPALSLEERREIMTSRLKAREAERQSANASRRETQDMGFMQEKVKTFWGAFETGKADADAKCAAVQALGRGAESAAALAACTESIARLQARVSEASHFLPSYDVRKAQSAVDELRKAVGVAKDAVAPRKKFSFAARRKQAKAEKAARAAAAAAAAPVLLAAPAAEQPTTDATPANYRAGDQVSDVAAESLLESSGERAHIVSMRTGETICVGARELACATSDGGAERKAVRLSQLTDCTVYIVGVAGALRAENLTRCKIYAGPVSGSCLMFDLIECVVAIAARQFRLHRCLRTDFYVRSRSGPIIEHCSALRFAPYHVQYAALDDELALPSVGLALSSAEEIAAEQTGGAWGDVKDFNWHRVQHSPNWSVLPAAERVAAPPPAPATAPPAAPPALPATAPPHETDGASSDEEEL